MTRGRQSGKIAFETRNQGSLLQARHADSGQPILCQRAKGPTRPYLHPVIAPDGDGTLTEDRPDHHPWQHGIYTGLHGVNGEEFWTERPDRDGRFDPRIADEKHDSKGGLHWKVCGPWLAADGRPLMQETQAWSLSHDPAAKIHRIDFFWTLQAVDSIRVDQCAYGGLFVRMPWSRERFHQVANSEGIRDQPACEGQPARWVAVALAPPDRRSKDPVGIAILEHPTSPDHPNRWRVDGQFGFSPSRCIRGPWTIPSGESTTSRYRLLAFAGAVDADFLEQEWQSFANL